MTTVDLHSDLLADVEARRVQGERDVFRARHLPALQAAGVRVQGLAIYIDTAFVPEGALRRALSQVEAAHRDAEESEGALRIVSSAAELDEALADGAVAGILAFEGTEALGRDPGLIRLFARLGVRLTGLTWNRATAFSDGLVEDSGGGISPLGRRLLAEMEECGIALDLAHLPRRATEQALELFGGEVLCSHGNAHAVWANGRNNADDVLDALAARDGVCGLAAQRVFVGPGEAAEQLAAHRDHIASRGAGLPAWGGDFTDFLPEGTPEPPHLGLPPDSDRSLNELGEIDRRTIYGEVDALVRAAHGDGAADALAHGNALRFLRRALG